jgi:hypothetical protein
MPSNMLRCCPRPPLTACRHRHRHRHSKLPYVKRLPMQSNNWRDHAVHGSQPSFRFMSCKRPLPLAATHV